MNTPNITVSHKGGEKKVCLSVQPSLELSDSDVEQAEGELLRSLRRLFGVEASVAFYLHEVETGRVMSRESFREPSYCQAFPTHWYLVVDSNSTALMDGSASGVQYTNGPVLVPEDISRLGEVMSSLDLEESGLTSLADLSTDAKYQSFTMTGVGDSGCSLRYFSIQPITSVRSDTPMEQSDSRSHSRSDSYVSSASADSLDALKLSTTFVGEVREGSLAAEAGVSRGFVVHMVNKDSILRASVEQMKLLVEQSGEEVTLLGLPQDNDDLQFLYSHYTTGEAGQFSTDDGFITVVDIPLILGSTSLSSNGLSPPVGMVPFDAHSGSQENSLSCDPYTLSGDKHGTDDILIMGSLSEIGTRENSNWAEDTDQLRSPPSNAHHNGLAAGKEWYQQDEEEDLSPPPHDGRGSSSETSNNTAQSKQQSRKSLEALTRISSFDEERAAMDSSVDGKRYTHISNSRRSQSFNSSHGCPSSDNSQQSSGSVRGQVSAHPEEQRMSGDSMGSGTHGSSLIRSTSSCSSSQLAKGTAAAGGRHAVRGYQARRKELHKARSKNTMSELAEAELQQSWGERSWGEKEVGGTTNAGGSGTNVDASNRYGPPVVADGDTTPSPLRSRTSMPVIRHGSVKERVPESPPQLLTTRDKPRPLSAIEPQATSTHLAPGSTHLAPGSAHTYNFKSADSSEQPLYNTITALSPFGEQEVFREVNIEEAIARSQGNVLSCQDHSNSSLDNMSAGQSTRNSLTRHRSIDSGSALCATGSGVPLGPSTPADNSRNEIICHGLLSIKQDASALGKKSQDRSWRNYYAVLAGTKITFYRDKRDAVLEKPSEELPLDVVPAVVDLEAKNTKRKFAFRLMTSLGQSYFLQADDAPNRQRWMDLIQKQNVKYQSTWQSKMVQLSPQSVRRLSSPQPGKSTGPGPGGGGGLFGRLKRTLIRHQRDEADHSSFITFGQLLKDCPVSPDNKRVPLVVEFCVGEVEEHGLTVEGIYRKPGLVAMINNMSAQMDKGNYLFDFSDYGQDVHTVASLLKKFLKDLPDALLPDNFYHKFVACARLPEEETRLSVLKDLVFQLPTAHYHTLRFIMRHLGKVVAHSKENKMTLRNVALVFGPTLMRSSADGEEELLSSMAAGYTIVELLCKHCEYLCAADLCAEEIEAPAEQEDLPIHAPSSRIEKEQALANASPRTVRRIKNRISNDKDIALKRHSSALPESYGSIPKLVNNSSGVATLGYAGSSRGHLHTSDSNINATSTLQQEGEGAGSKKRPVRHTYEDVEVTQRDDSADRGKSSTRTMNWINHHTEMNWGRGEDSREVTGSMWSSRNRVPRQNSKEKLRNGSNTRKVVKTKSDQGKEALSTYQPPRHARQPSAPSRELEDRGPSRGPDDRGQPSRGLSRGLEDRGPSRGPDDRGQPSRGLSRGVDDRGPSRGPDDRGGPSRGMDDRVPSRGPDDRRLSRGMDDRGLEDKVLPLVTKRSEGRGQGVALKSRRTSYMSAMNEPTEIPVRETSSPTNPPQRRDLGNPPQRRDVVVGSPVNPPQRRDVVVGSPVNPPQRRDVGNPQRSAYTGTDYGLPYNRHGNSSRGYGAAQSHMYSHFSAHPSLQQRVGKYSTLQHDMTAPTNPPPPHHRRSSESMDPALEVRKPQQYLHSRVAPHGHRTFSNDRPYTTHNSPPQRGDGTAPQGTRQPRTAQVESYL